MFGFPLTWFFLKECSVFDIICISTKAKAYPVIEVKDLNSYEILNIPPTAGRTEIRAAYRALARRWHPDRFMEGPERDWANEKMAEINSAYRDCLNGTGRQESAENADNEVLAKVQRLMDDGKYISARKLLMGVSTRCAEWNYLFGAVLMRLCETEKALIYLSVAAHQNPSSVKYARALNEARSAQSGLKSRFAAKFGLKRG